MRHKSKIAASVQDTYPRLSLRRGDSPMEYSYVYTRFVCLPEHVQIKKNTIYSSASDRIFRGWNYHFHRSRAVNLACKLSDTGVRGNDIRAECDSSVGVRFFSCFFNLPLFLLRDAHDRPDFKVPIREEGLWKKKSGENKEEYSISLDSCHGHVSDAREQWELDTLAGC